MKELNNHDFCAIIFSPRSLIGAHLSKDRLPNRFRLRSLFHYPLSKLELERLTLFNPTDIGRKVAEWCTPYRPHGPIAFALHGPAIEEHLFATHNAHPSMDQFPIQHAPFWQWEHTYLFSRNHQHYFYLCGIKKSLLFQYQLMAITNNIPVSLITTERMALAHCFRNLFGVAYRSAHIADAMEMHNDRIENLFFNDDFSRILSTPPDIEIKDEFKLPLLTACGLFSMQGS